MNTIIEILIDNSNSMGPFEVEKNKGKYLLPDRSTRMSLAKKILSDEILPIIDYATKVTVRLFYFENVGKWNTYPKIKNIYDTNFDIVALSEKIKAIPDPINTGGTPITLALKTSVEALCHYPEDDKKIILVTDGGETGGDDYKKATEIVLKKYGISCKIFIIGIAQDNAAERKSKELAKITEGSYIGLNSMNYQRESLQNLLIPLKQEVIKSISEIKTTEISIISTDIEKIEPIIPENPEQNERVRVASETFLFEKLKQEFGEQIIWLNEEGESGRNHDFEVLDILGKTVKYFIECKGSMYKEKVFLLTKNEWHFFLDNTQNYQIFFVSNALLSPELTKIDNFRDWLFRGKVVPYASKNMPRKAERIFFEIVE